MFFSTPRCNFFEMLPSNRGNNDIECVRDFVHASDSNFHFCNSTWSFEEVTVAESIETISVGISANDCIPSPLKNRNDETKANLAKSNEKSFHGFSPPFCKL